MNKEYKNPGVDFSKDERGVILSVKNLSTHFNLEAGLFAAKREKVLALNEVSFSLYEGESYGIVGESGSGKTTLAKTVAGIFKKSSGDFFWRDGNDAHQMQYVFQNSATALNPRMTVFELLTHGYCYAMKKIGEGKVALKKRDLFEKVNLVLQSVGLDESATSRRASDFSGGQRQRIALARALMFEPKVLICDEVVSALDVSIQAQILNLLIDLKAAYNFSMIFIAHDLSVVSYLCDRIAVMNSGYLVEEGRREDLVLKPLHPYTQLLYRSILTPGSKKIHTGNFSDFYKSTMTNTFFEGCPFLSRCDRALPCCKKDRPSLMTFSNNHRTACFNPIQYKN